MEEKFLICDDIIIPIKTVLLIKKENEKNKYGIKLCNKESGTFVEWQYISASSFEQIKESMIAEKKYQKKIKKLEAKIKALELHISLSPGGYEYLKAQEDFSTGQKNELTKE